MSKLISWAKMQEVRRVSDNNSKRFELISQEVEDLELSKLLGAKLYQQVSDDPEMYSDLLDATGFTRCDGTTIKHKGLHYVICYLIYAQYILESDVADTFSGMVSKNLPNSQPLSTGRLKELNQHYREIAFNAFALISEYLNTKTDEAKYAEWCSSNSSRVRKPIFYGIKKTY